MEETRSSELQLFPDWLSHSFVASLACPASTFFVCFFLACAGNNKCASCPVTMLMRKAARIKTRNWRERERREKHFAGWVVAVVGGQEER